jgi:hypothetical protein
MTSQRDYRMTADERTITAGIPTYWRSKCLMRAIGSMLARTYPEAEIIVFDKALGCETAAMSRAVDDRRLGFIEQPRNVALIETWRG